MWFETNTMEIPLHIEQLIPSAVDVRNEHNEKTIGIGTYRNGHNEKTIGINTYRNGHRTLRMKTETSKELL